MADRVKKEIRLWKKDRWERLRRNPDYISDYNKLNEQKRRRPKKVEERDEWRRKDIVSYLTICDKYGLSKPIDPRRKFNKKFSNFIDLTDGYVHFPTKDGRFTPAFPIRKGSFMCVDHRCEPAYRTYTREEALVDEKYLSVMIDVDLPDKMVRQIASNAVKTAKSAMRIKEDTFRMRLEENQIAYDVWDKRAEKKSFVKIAREVFPGEPSKRGAERARKAYTRAYELISERKYEPFKRREIRREHLRKTCDSCTDRDCRVRAMKNPANWIPCPEVLAFIEQDQVSLREKLSKT